MNIRGCSDCPIDDWVHGCHLDGGECATILKILEDMLERESEKYLNDNSEEKEGV